MQRPTEFPSEPKISLQIYGRIPFDLGLKPPRGEKIGI
jgi:hypothetical protein